MTHSVYVNLATGCRLTTGSRKLFQQWLNPSCFQNPSAGQLGTAGNFQSQVRNPGIATEDISAHKSVAIGPDRQYNLTVWIEFFNVFNRNQLGGPDTNLGDATFGQIISYGGLGGVLASLGPASPSSQF